MVHGPDAPSAARSAWAATGATLIEAEAPGGTLATRPALAALAARGLTRILCEGGGTLAARLVAETLVDDLALYSAGCLIGADGIPALGPLGLAALKDAPRPTLTETRTLGPDLFSLWSF